MNSRPVRPYCVVGSTLREIWSHERHQGPGDHGGPRGTMGDHGGPWGSAGTMGTAVTYCPLFTRRCARRRAPWPCFCALVTGAHIFLRRMESLHRNKGGAKSKRAEPSEKEGMGLAVGAAMLWCKLRDSSSGAFFPKISEDMGSLIQKNRPTPPLAMASDRSLSSASPSSRAPHESPCLATAGAGSSCTTQWLLPIRSARPRERFSDLLTMIGGTTNTFGVSSNGVPGARELAAWHRSPAHGFTWNHVSCIAPTKWCPSRATKVPPAWPSRPRWLLGLSSHRISRSECTSSGALGCSGAVGNPN